MKKYIAYLIGMVVLLIFQQDHPSNYSYEDLKDYLGALGNVSGMVFTIMGIWIAFLYPNALNRITNPTKVAAADFSETLHETKRLEEIVSAIMKSAITMTLSLAMILTRLLIKETDFYSHHHQFLKDLALSITVVMSAIQFEAVLKVIHANIMFITELHWKRQQRKAEEEL